MARRVITAREQAELIEPFWRYAEDFRPDMTTPAPPTTPDPVPLTPPKAPKTPKAPKPTLQELIQGYQSSVENDGPEAADAAISSINKWISYRPKFKQEYLHPAGIPALKELLGDLNYGDLVGVLNDKHHKALTDNHRYDAHTGLKVPKGDTDEDVDAAAQLLEPTGGGLEAPKAPGQITPEILEKHYPGHTGPLQHWTHLTPEGQKQKLDQHLTWITTPGQSGYSPSHAEKWKAIHEDAFGEPWTGDQPAAKSVAENAAEAFGPAGFKVKTQDEFFADHAPPGSGPQPQQSSGIDYTEQVDPAAPWATTGPGGVGHSQGFKKWLQEHHHEYQGLGNPSQLFLEDKQGYDAATKAYAEEYNKGKPGSPGAGDPLDIALADLDPESNSYYQNWKYELDDDIQQWFAQNPKAAMNDYYKYVDYADGNYEPGERWYPAAVGDYEPDEPDANKDQPAPAKAIQDYKPKNEAEWQQFFTVLNDTLGFGDDKTIGPGLQQAWKEISDADWKTNIEGSGNLGKNWKAYHDQHLGKGDSPAGGLIPPASMAVPSHLLDPQGALDPGLLNFIWDKYGKHTHDQDNPAPWLDSIFGQNKDNPYNNWKPGDWEVVAEEWDKLSKDSQLQWQQKPLIPALAQAVLNHGSATKEEAAPQFDAAKAAAEYGKIIGIGPDVHSGGKAYKDMSQEEFQTALNNAYSKWNSIDPEKAAPIQALYTKLFGDSVPAQGFSPDSAAGPQIDYADVAKQLKAADPGYWYDAKLKDLQNWSPDKLAEQLESLIQKGHEVLQEYDEEMEQYQADKENWEWEKENDPQDWHDYESYEDYESPPNPAYTQHEVDTYKKIYQQYFGELPFRKIQNIADVLNEVHPTTYYDPTDFDTLNEWKSHLEDLIEDAQDDGEDDLQGQYQNLYDKYFGKPVGPGAPSDYDPAAAQKDWLKIWPSDATVWINYGMDDPAKAKAYVEKAIGTHGKHNPEKAQKMQEWLDKYFGGAAGQGGPGPVPFTGGVDFAKEYMAATDWAGVSPELINSGGLKFSEMTAEQAKEKLEQFLDGTMAWGGDDLKPKVQALYDKYFGAGIAPEVSAHEKFVTDPVFKDWFKQDNSFDLDTDDKDGSLKKMLLDSHNPWTQGKLRQFKKWAQGQGMDLDFSQSATEYGQLLNTDQKFHNWIEDQKSSQRAFYNDFPQYALAHWEDKKAADAAAAAKFTVPSASQLTALGIPLTFAENIANLSKEQFKSYYDYVKDQGEDAYPPDSDWGKIVQFIDGKQPDPTPAAPTKPALPVGDGVPYWAKDGAGLKPEFTEWLWNKADKNLTPEQFADVVGDWDAQHWAAAAQAWKASQGPGADPTELPSAQDVIDHLVNQQNSPWIWNGLSSGSTSVGLKSLYGMSPEAVKQHLTHWLDSHSSGIAASAKQALDELYGGQTPPPPAAAGAAGDYAPGYQGPPVEWLTKHYPSSQYWDEHLGHVPWTPENIQKWWNDVGEGSLAGLAWADDEKDDKAAFQHYLKPTAPGQYAPPKGLADLAHAMSHAGGGQWYTDVADWTTWAHGLSSGQVAHYLTNPEDADAAFEDWMSDGNDYDQFRKWYKDTKTGDFWELPKDPAAFTQAYTEWKNSTAPESGSAPATESGSAPATGIGSQQHQDKLDQLADEMHGMVSPDQEQTWTTHGAGDWWMWAHSLSPTEVQEYLHSHGDASEAFSDFVKSDDSYYEFKDWLSDQHNLDINKLADDPQKFGKLYHQWKGDTPGAAETPSSPLTLDQWNEILPGYTLWFGSVLGGKSAEQQQQALQKWLQKYQDNGDFSDVLKGAITKALQDHLGGAAPPAAAAPAAPGQIDWDDVISKVKQADPTHWGDEETDPLGKDPAAWQKKLKEMIKDGEEYLAAGYGSLWSPQEVQIYKDLLAKYFTGTPSGGGSTPASWSPSAFLKSFKEFFPKSLHETHDFPTADKAKSYLEEILDGASYFSTDSKAKAKKVYDQWFGQGATSTGGGGDESTIGLPPGLHGGPKVVPLERRVRDQLTSLTDLIKAPHTIFTDDDLAVVTSPQFQKWFAEAPEPYRQVASQFPMVPLDDFERGGEYSAVPESDDPATVYRLFHYPEATEAGGRIKHPSGQTLKLPGDFSGGGGKGHWPGHTKNPESKDRARPRVEFAPRGPKVPNQLELPLPGGSSWEPEVQFPELRRGIGVNFNRYKDPGQAKLLKLPGEAGARHREAKGLLDEIRELMVGSRGLEDDDDRRLPTLFDDETSSLPEGAPEVNRYSKVDDWLELFAWGQKNQLTPEQMWLLAKQGGSKTPDKWGTAPLSFLVEQSKRNPRDMARQVSALIGTTDWHGGSNVDLDDVARKLRRVKDDDDYGQSYDQETRDRAAKLYDQWFGEGLFNKLLADKILDYLELGAWKPSDFKSHPDFGGLGPHWTTKKRTDFGTGGSANPNEFQVEVIADWPGLGEDPDRKDSAWGYTSEQEITKNPGTPVIVKKLRIKHPGNHDTNEWMDLDVEPHIRYAHLDPEPVAARKPGRTVLRHAERYGDPMGDWFGMGDAVQPGGPPVYGRPEHYETPRWRGDERPVLPDGTRHFSPDEVNPASTALSRPDVNWQAKEPEQPELFEGYQSWHDAPLFRGLAVNLHAPEAADLHRLIFGESPRDRYLFDTPAHDTPQWDHPELGQAILDHLQAGHRNSWNGLGRHWTVDPTQAHEFALSSYYDLTNPPGAMMLPVRIRAGWGGTGENPYRHDTGEEYDGQFLDEQEMNLLPGARLNIQDVQIRPPGKTWMSLGGGQPVQRHAAVRPRTAKRILTQRELLEG